MAIQLSIYPSIQVARLPSPGFGGALQRKRGQQRPGGLAAGQGATVGKIHLRRSRRDDVMREHIWEPKQLGITDPSFAFTELWIKGAPGICLFLVPMEHTGAICLKALGPQSR